MSLHQTFCFANIKPRPYSSIVVFWIAVNPQTFKSSLNGTNTIHRGHASCHWLLSTKRPHSEPIPCNNPNDKSLKAQGNNLFCRDTIQQNKDIESIKFDLVVGNPPFGTTDLSESMRSYCDEHKFAKEMVLPFLHKATRFAPNGVIALIFNTKVLTNTGGTYQNFRKWLFNDCYV